MGSHEMACQSIFHDHGRIEVEGGSLTQLPKANLQRSRRSLPQPVGRDARPFVSLLVESRQDLLHAVARKATIDGRVQICELRPPGIAAEICDCVETDGLLG